MTRIRVFAIGGLLCGLLLGSVPSAMASSHGRYGAAAGRHQLVARIDHRFMGVVPSARAGGRRNGRPTAREFAGTRFASAKNLLYWGGPVMATNTTYAIYWLGNAGTVSSGYESIINGFFNNLQAAQNATGDVYAVDTQYYGPTGAHIANQSSVGATAAVDTTNSIPNDCSAEYAGTGVNVSGGCVTDQDIQSEVARMIQAHGWTPGPTALFFVFTPNNVGSCIDGTSGECAYTYYCAYHSNYVDSSNREVMYANLPYSLNSGAPGACDSGQYPNGDQAADDTINLISHEHNEAITDPLGTAWYDSSGNEIGDKCAWNFGSGPWPSTGASSASEYNQTIGTGHYYVQQEWSNASSGCALNYGGTSSGGSLAVTGFSPSKATTGTTVTITGSGFASGDSVYFNGVPSATVNVTSATQLTAVVPSTASSGPIKVTSSGGSSATSSTSFVVIPSITSFSPTSGTPGTSVIINGSGFTGASRVTFGGTSASFTVVSATQIRATVPRRARSGRIAVTTSGGTAQSSGSFTVT
jgi:hypothetical protein